MVPQVQVDPATLPAAFSLNLPLARPGRCHAPLRDLPEEKICSILEAAAQFRLQRKAQRLQRLERAARRRRSALPGAGRGARLQAKQAGFHPPRATDAAGKTLRPRPNEIEAVLFGLAGFLGAPDLADFERGTRQYLRVLWDQWWPRRANWSGSFCRRGTWRLSGTRPLNHPQRRLAALAGIVADWPKLLRSLGKDELGPVREFFLELRASLLEFPLHPHLRAGGEGDGADRRDADHRDPGQRHPALAPVCRRARPGRITRNCPPA